MRRDIFHGKIDIAYGNFRMTSFEEILNYFKLRNGWLNSKLCAKCKLLYSNQNAYSNENVFFVKKEIRLIGKLDSLRNFVPLYFSFLLPLFLEL